MGFWDKLLDSTDKTVSAHIFFIGLALLSVIVIGFIYVMVLPDHFNIKDFGISIGALLGGGGVYAGGSVIQGSRDVQ